MTLFDDEHSENEDKWITIGQTPNNRILVVVHTLRKVADKEVVRIISARKATKKEAQQYYERRDK